MGMKITLTGGSGFIDGWGGASEAKTILVESMARYEGTADKPKF